MLSIPRKPTSKARLPCPLLFPGPLLRWLDHVCLPAAIALTVLYLQDHAGNANAVLHLLVWVLEEMLQDLDPTCRTLPLGALLLTRAQQGWHHHAESLLLFNFPARIMKTEPVGLSVVWALFLLWMMGPVQLGHKQGWFFFPCRLMRMVCLGGFIFNIILSLLKMSYSFVNCWFLQGAVPLSFSLFFHPSCTINLFILAEFIHRDSSKLTSSCY